MNRCTHCDGFIPAERSACPNCARVSTQRRVLGVLGASVAAVTLMACYGASPNNQSDECRAYVACYEKTGGTKGHLDSTYGPDGTCWTTTTTAAHECTSACKTAAATLKSSFPDAGC